jgi:hypothetical protein
VYIIKRYNAITEIYMTNFTMSTVTFVYREFDKNDSNHIAVYKIPNNQLEISIMGLQDNSDIDEGNIAVLIVDYPETSDLYDVINTIFDKITDDHRYKLQGYMSIVNNSNIRSELNYTDNIFILRTDPNTKNMTKTVLEFNRENTKHLEETISPKQDLITIYGEVHDDGRFTYDSPIISINDQKYYRKTRGKRTWDIDFDKNRKQYYETNWEDVVRAQRPYLDVGDYEGAVYYGELASIKVYDDDVDIGKPKVNSNTTFEL